MPNLAAKDTAEGTSTGRRRYVTLLFADLCNYTALGESADPEEADQLRRDIEDLALRIVRKQHGSVSQCYGDGILAVFGLPAPREDDSRRAVETALELHRALSEGRLPRRITGFDVRMHMGIHAGLVFAREGDVLHGRYDLTGDAVNTAARLCEAAGPDEIFVSGTALRGIEGFFLTEKVPELSLKGKREPVTVWRVTGRSEARTRFEARSRQGLTSFVGREAELATLIRLVNESMVGRRRVALISGAPGVGKSRLLEELRSRVSAAGVRVLRGSCESFGDTPPLEPFLHVLRRLFGLVPGSTMDEAVLAVQHQIDAWGHRLRPGVPILLQLLSLSSSTTPSPFPIAAELPIERVFADLVAALCSESPVLLLLDDWQWADDMSHKVLRGILNEAQDRRLVVVVSMREIEDTASIIEDAELLPLSPFNETESLELIKALRPDDLDQSLVRAIQRRSGGNALFLEELCHSPAESANVESGAPTTLQGIIQTRIAALPANQARLLSAASVIGTEFSLPLLCQVLEDDELPLVLDELARGDLIHLSEIERTFRFKHGITRDVIYESVLIAERRRIHRAVATAIERAVADGALADQSEALAYHYRGASDHERAAAYAEQAGNKAAMQSALDRARAQYKAALSSLDQLPETPELERRWLEISLKWSEACVYSVARNQLAILERASAYAQKYGDRVAQTQTEYWLGWLHYALGDHLDATTHFKNALEYAASAHDERFIAQLWANVGQSHAAAGEYVPALDYLGRSIHSKRARAQRGPNHPVAQGFAYALACRASVHADIGDFERADQDLEEALELLKGTSHAVEGSVMALRTMVEIHRGNWAAALDSAAKSRKIAERVASAYVYVTCTAYEAYARFMFKCNADALQKLKRAVDWLEVREVGLFISFAYGCVADASMTNGEIELATRYAERALHRAARGDALGETVAHRTLARVHAARVPPDEAALARSLAEAFRSAEARGSERDFAITLLLDAELKERAGNRGEAGTAAARALESFERMGMPWYAARARRLLD